MSSFPSPKWLLDYFENKPPKPKPEPEEETKALPHEPGTFKPLSLFDKYMFAKSYIRLLKFQLDRSRKQNRVLQDEIVEYKKELAHLKTLFRKDKRLPKN